MTGIDFEDTIVVRSTCKGTNIIREHLKSMKWAGVKFKEEQEGKLDKKKKFKILSSKGTSTLDLKALRRPKTPKIEGHYISTNKGTGLRKL